MEVENVRCFQTKKQRFLFVKMIRYRLTRLNIPANIVSFVRFIAPYEAEWFFFWIFIKTISELVQAGGPFFLQTEVFIRRQQTTT